MFHSIGMKYDHGSTCWLNVEWGVESMIVVAVCFVAVGIVINIIFVTHVIIIILATIILTITTTIIPLLPPPQPTPQTPPILHPSPLLIQIQNHRHDPPPIIAQSHIFQQTQLPQGGVASIQMAGVARGAVAFVHGELALEGDDVGVGIGVLVGGEGGGHAAD